MWASAEQAGRDGQGGTRRQIGDMMRTLRLGLTAALAAALLLVGTGTGLAATSQLARNGHERFALITPALKAGTQVRATGVLVARGSATEPRPPRIWLHFARGSIRLVLTTTSSSASPPNPANCRFTEVYHGDYQLTAGLRGYHGARGSGTFVTNIAGRLVRSHGACLTQLASLRQTTITTGTLRW
jgi:hypothetical protein